MSDAINNLVLDSLRARITRIIPRQITECIEKLDEEKLWWRPNEDANSIGNLVLHLTGSVRHYLCHQIGGVDFKRDRPAEFAERGPIPKEQLLQTWDSLVKEATTVLDKFDPNQLAAASKEPDYVKTQYEMIYNVSLHMATHAGQIIWVTKMLQEGKLDEIWIKAHREESARQKA